MKTIYKYQITAPEEVIHIPTDAKILRVDNLDGKLCLWAELDTSKPSVERLFKIIPTGGNVPEHAVYLGTAFYGSLVFHIYEIKS